MTSGSINAKNNMVNADADRNEIQVRTANFCVSRDQLLVQIHLPLHSWPALSPSWTGCRRRQQGFAHDRRRSDRHVRALRRCGPRRSTCESRSASCRTSQMSSIRLGAPSACVATSVGAVASDAELMYLVCAGELVSKPSGMLARSSPFRRWLHRSRTQRPAAA